MPSPSSPMNHCWALWMSIFHLSCSTNSADVCLHCILFQGRWMLCGFFLCVLFALYSWSIIVPLCMRFQDEACWDLVLCWNNKTINPFCKLFFSILCRAPLCFVCVECWAVFILLFIPTCITFNFNRFVWHHCFDCVFWLCRSVCLCLCTISFSFITIFI